MGAYLATLARCFQFAQPEFGFRNLFGFIFSGFARGLELRIDLFCLLGVLLGFGLRHVTSFYLFRQVRLDFFGTSYMFSFGFAQHAQRDGELLLLLGQQLSVGFSLPAVF